MAIHVKQWKSLSTRAPNYYKVHKNALRRHRYIFRSFSCRVNCIRTQSVYDVVLSGSGNTGILEERPVVYSSEQVTY